MSYIDAYRDNEKDIIKVVERENGKRVFREYKTKYVLYYEDPNGEYRTLWGKPCKKYSTTSSKDFKRQKHLVSDKILHESDINPIFRCLEENYNNKDAPSLNVAFFDIETDFDPYKGFADPWEPFAKITAITVYQKWTQKLITFVIKPDLDEKDPYFLSFDDAEAITNKFENCYLCDSESLLLELFLESIKDADILSGWNCLDKKSYVSLNDRIKRLSDCKKGDINLLGDIIKDTNDSGLKKKFIIKSANGNIINSSIEHRYPVTFKKIGSHTNVNQIIKTKTDMTLQEIIDKRNLGYDVYLETVLKGNNNKDLTWKKYIYENFDELFEYDWFDLSIDDKEFLKFLRRESRVMGIYDDIGFSTDSKVHEKTSSHSMRNLMKYFDKSLFLNHINEQSKINLAFKSKRRVMIDLDEVISKDYLSGCGFIFTDGHYSKYDRGFGCCNKVLEVMQHHCGNLGFKIPTKPRKQDSCYYSGKMCAKLQLASTMFYDNKWNKTISVERMSMLSIDQWAGFISGVIDGDGSSSGLGVGFCNFQNNTEQFQVLNSWFGIQCLRTDTNINIPFNTHNEFFMDKLEISHPNKKKYVETRVNRSVNKSPNPNIKSFYKENVFYYRIEDIKETNEMIEMADISTETQYFICNGTRVHNSTGYDIPYTVNRVREILGEQKLHNFNAFPNTKPKMRKYIKFKKEQKTYDLIGRVHLDYLELYQKHSQAEMSSYRLDYIGQVEVGEQKVQYDGTLDMLYKRDFEKFIAYNRQDVALLDKIDNKLKYIELANQIAHTNTVLIQTTMGSVALIEQAIVNESHRRGMVVPNRKNKFDDYDFDSEMDDDMLDDTFSINKGPAVGAHVADPKIGLHSEIGCCDINSLYPSAIRALDMSPETLVGQIRNDRTNDFILERIKSGMSGPEAWHNVFCLIEFDLIHNKTDDLLILDLIDGTSMEMTAKEVYDMVYSEDSNFVLSANCTIFDKSRKGIIPGLLEKWYAERKEMKSYSESYIEICEKGLEIDSELAELLMN